MRIVVVEDNLSLAKGLSYRLQDDGHSVDLIHDGDEAARFLGQQDCDLIILDINLPGQSGLEVLSQIRAAGDPRPVILLTAQGSTEDRVAGLDAGADDYLAKPFSMDELAARVRAVGRRKRVTPRRTSKVGQLELDLETFQLSHGSTIIDVPKRELAVLSVLAEAHGRAVGKQTLLDHVYGTGSATDEKVIEVYVSRLRKRLHQFGVSIRTDRGIGYSLVVPNQ